MEREELTDQEEHDTNLVEEVDLVGTSETQTLVRKADPPFIFTFFLLIIGVGFPAPWQIPQFIWTLINFVIVIFVSVVATWDTYHKFKSFFMFAVFLAWPVPLITLAFNYYFHQSGTWKSLLQFVQAKLGSRSTNAAGGNFNLFSPTFPEAIRYVLILTAITPMVASAIITALLIAFVFVPFIRHHADDALLVLANCVNCALMLWWFMTAFAFPCVINALATLVISAVERIKKYGRGALDESAGRLAELEKVTTHTCHHLQATVLIVLVGWSTSFVLLNFAFFFQNALDNVPTWFLIVGDICIPTVVIFTVKRMSDVTAAFQKLRRSAARWIARSNQKFQPLEAQFSMFYEARRLEDVLARAGWTVFGYMVGRGIVIVMVAVSVFTVAAFLQHMVHIQL